jgi:hypothetical protein
MAEWQLDNAWQGSRQMYKMHPSIPPFPFGTRTRSPGTAPILVTSRSASSKSGETDAPLEQKQKMTRELHLNI